AMKKYQEALIIKPGEKYPKVKIEECQKNMKQLATDEASAKKYNETIASADKLFKEKKWEDAKKKYNEASAISPVENYPKTRLKRIMDIQDSLSNVNVDTTKVSTKDLINSYAGNNGNPDKKNLVEFRIQFASSDKEIEAGSVKLKGLKDITYYKVGAILKYTAGNFRDPNEATAYQAKVRELGYKDAFVVAFKNGERIDYKEALKLVK
ncbi:MAG TPA: hypothetical protein VGF30_07820, partial [Bacteroidia bacterium]